MAEKRVVEILKKAIIIERQGMVFYSQVAEQTKSEAVKNIFSIMAEEEKKHMETLTAQYRSYEKDGGFSSEIALGSPNDFSDKILSQKIREEIHAATYEAASISAAIAMEKEAVDLYSRRADEAEDPEEKKLYRELSMWEKTHAGFLGDIYSDLIEDSWYDADFWPF
jgi:rubrerythrin